MRVFHSYESSWHALQVAAMSTKRHSAAAAVLGGKLYVAGSPAFGGMGSGVGREVGVLADDRCVAVGLAGGSGVAGSLVCYICMPAMSGDAHGCHEWGCPWVS